MKKDDQPGFWLDIGERIVFVAVIGAIVALVLVFGEY